MSQSRQLAAIMFTDIVGYTALMDEDEQKAFELLKKNRQVQRPLIEKYHGRWLKEMGDGVLASFTTVTDAVYCAAAIQKTCEGESDLNLRIGIHQGEVVFDGEDVFGSGVNIASRLEPLAPVGGILVSESVHKNLINKTDIQSTFVGEEHLKNIRESVRVYQVQVEGIDPMIVEPETTVAIPPIPSKGTNPRKLALGAAGIILIIMLSYFLYANFGSQQSLAEAPQKITDKSIAVLPFKNDSPDADNQYFADGMMDEILNHLQKIAELGVKSRTAVEPYRNSTLSFGAIAEELEVSFVLEGAVRKYGERFRVTTQLIEVESGNHLWSETYDGIFSDTIFVIQSNIAKKIAASLNAMITPDEEGSLNKTPTTDVAAYDLYIRGNHERLVYWNLRDERHLKFAHNLFDEALKIDPNYLQAIVGKGETFIAESNPDSAFTYADRAIDLDPNSNKGYGLKGECYMRLGKSDLAIEFFLKAIELPPKDDFWFWYHDALGRVYIHQKNNLLKGLPYIKKGLETSIEHRHYWQVGNTYLTIGDYETANEYLQKSLDLRPNIFSIRNYSRMMLVQGKYQEAFQFVDSICQKLDYGCFSILFQASLLLSEFEQAEQYYNQWQSTGSNSFARSNNYQIGYVYHKLGKTVEAEKIFAEKIQQLESELANEQRNVFGVLPYYKLIDLSRIHAFQGNKKQALKYLAEYAELGFSHGWHDFILIDPFFESLRDNPEFKAIVKQAQEEKAALRAQVREMEERGALTL